MLMMTCFRLIRLLLLTPAVLFVFAPQTAAADVVESVKLTASDGAKGDAFGHSVSISGDTLVIGAAYEDGDEPNSGSAYVFRHNGSDWVEEAKLTISGGVLDDQFGWSVSISGDAVAVGARHRDANEPDSGSAYVFRYDGTVWVEEAKLTAFDGAVDDLFGHAISIFGDTVVVGSRRDDNVNGIDAGSAYVFRYDGNGWVGEAKLAAFDGAEDDEFGYSVSVLGDAIAVGAHGDDDKEDGSGSAYVFRYDGSDWVDEAKLAASDGVARDAFGRSVSFSGDTLVIGASNGHVNGAWPGSAYVFRNDGSDWVQEAKLLASDGASADHFGESVSVFGDTVMVGARLNYQGATPGSAYVFGYDGSSWVEEAKLIPSDGAAGDEFGFSVAVSDDTLVVGSRRNDNGTASGSGSAYLFIGDLDVVEIDIKPDSDANTINLKSRGLIPVAILGSNSFDVLDVDVRTLAFGRTGAIGAAPAHMEGGHLEDVDNDGFTDLVSHYRTRETRIAAGDSRACVAGEMLDGTPFKDCDTILVVRGSGKGCGLGFELVLLLPGLMWLRQRRVLLTQSNAG
jgi:hypothetical protein